MSHILHDNGGRRSGIEMREFLYNEYIPERRSGKDRRSGNDRRLKQRTSKKFKQAGQSWFCLFIIRSLISAMYSIF